MMNSSWLDKWFPFDNWGLALKDLIRHVDYVRTGGAFSSIAFASHAEAFGYCHSVNPLDNLNQAEATLEQAVKNGILKRKSGLVCPVCYNICEEVYPEDAETLLKTISSYECPSCGRNFNLEPNDIKSLYVLR